MHRENLCALALGVLLTASSLAFGQQSLDLDSCQDDLETLGKRASDASEAAESAKDKLNDLSECRENPDLYDLLRDGCQSLRSDYESAIGDLADSMDDVDTSLRSVQSSCGYEFTLNTIKPTEAAQRRLCNSYRKLVSLGISSQAVLQECKSHMTELWCKTCLDLK